MDGRPIAEFSSAELQAYACDHVFYEIDMFLRSVEAAIAGSLPMNFAIEAFTIHLRNLLDFFYPPPNGRKDDVVARHFFIDGSKWAPQAKSPLLVASHKRAHKEVAHLTTARHSDPAKKQWDIPGVHTDLEPTIRKFADEAEIVCDDFQAAALRRLDECASVVKQRGGAFGNRLRGELGVTSVATGLSLPRP